MMYFSQLSHEKKTFLLSNKSWLVTRDPYVMVYYNPYITGQYFIPTNPLNNKTGPLFHCSNSQFQLLELAKKDEDELTTNET